MQQFQFNNAKTIQFNRWTRKAWAVFCSLKQTVHIGHLIVVATGQALLKSAKSNSVLFSLLSSFNLETDAEDLNLTESLSIDEQQLLLSVVSSASQSSSSQSSSYFHNKLSFSFQYFFWNCKIVLTDETLIHNFRLWLISRY